MTPRFLGAAALAVVLAAAGLAALLFLREWLRGRRAGRLVRRLEAHRDLVERLRSAAPGAFPEAFRRLAVVEEPALREAILERAGDDAPEEAAPRLARACDDLGITERWMEVAEGSPSWEERARAAERLGRIGSRRAVPVLLRIVRNVKDEDEEVRGAALRALGRLRDPDALPELVEALGYPEGSLPPRIAEIVVRFGPAAVAPLTAELRNVDSDARRMWAAEILGWLGDRAAGPALVEALADVNPEVRAKSAGAIGKIGEARAVDRLLEMLLSDPIPFVRTRVAQALGALGHPKVIDHLIRVLKDPEWWVRIRAIEALEQIGKSAAGALVVALEDEDPEVRHRAATALERMSYVRDGIGALEIQGFRADVTRVLVLVGRAGVTEVLFASLAAAEGLARRQLVRLAGDIGNPAAVPLLRRLLAGNPDPKLKSRVVQALAKLGAREALPDIVACLGDPDDWVRRAAVEGLSALGPAGHVEEILRLLRDPAASTRQAVCRTLASVPGEASDAGIQGLLSDPSPDVRAEALRATAARGVAGREAEIRAMLVDASEEVRFEAARALAAGGGRGSVEAVLRAATGASGRVAEALSEALCRCHGGPFEELLAGRPGDPSPGQAALLLEAAARLGGRERLSFVSRYLGSPDGGLRRRAALALRGFAGPDVWGHVIRAMADPDPSVREAAVTVAGLAGGESFSPKLAELAADPAEGVRFRVALALSGAGPGRPALLALAADGAPAVRAAASLALILGDAPELAGRLQAIAADVPMWEKAREIFVPGAKDPLVARIVSEATRGDRPETRLFLGGSRFELEKEMAHRARTSLSAEERARALEVCEFAATGVSYPAALALLKNDPSPEVRARALRLLAAIRRDREAVGVVASVLLDPHPALRVKAAALLGELEHPEAVDALIHALDTADRDLREAVTTSLSRHLSQDPRRAEGLLAGIESRKTRKIGHVWLLGKTRRGGAIRVLLRYLEDEDGDVRASAVGALAKYRIGTVTRILRKSLSDPNGRVRAAAVNALARAPSGETEGDLERMLADPDLFVRRRAALGLLRMGATAARRRVRAMASEPEELRPVWTAGGVLLGAVAPEAARDVPDARAFLAELVPETEAEGALRSSAEPAVRLKGFRVLRALSPERAIPAARGLLADPDAAVRLEAERFLREPTRE